MQLAHMLAELGMMTVPHRQHGMAACVADGMNVVASAAAILKEQLLSVDDNFTNKWSAGNIEDVDTTWLLPVSDP